MYADNLMCGRSIDYDCKLEESGKVFLSEKVLLEEFVRSDVDFKTYRKYTEEADIFFIKDGEDKEPFKHFKRFFPIAMLLRIPYKIRDRKLNPKV